MTRHRPRRIAYGLDPRGRRLPAAAGDTVAATTPYRNIDDGTSDQTTTYVYSFSGPRVVEGAGF
jgi:hypothetical protein